MAEDFRLFHQNVSMYGRRGSPPPIAERPLCGKNGLWNSWLYSHFLLILSLYNLLFSAII